MDYLKFWTNLDGLQFAGIVILVVLFLVWIGNLGISGTSYKTKHQLYRPLFWKGLRNPPQQPKGLWIALAIAGGILSLIKEIVFIISEIIKWFK